MTKYAKNTQVQSGRSRDEIERTLTRYGAQGFIYGWQDNQAAIAFQMNGKHVKFIIPMPDRLEFKRTPTGRTRSASQINAEHEKAIRQKWRALGLVIKAKLEAVESGITCFEDEFMAHIVLPDGQTVGAWMRPQIESCNMPKLLPIPQ